MISSAGDRRSLFQRRECRDEEAESDLSLDAVVHEIDHLDVEIGPSSSRAIDSSPFFASM